MPPRAVKSTARGGRPSRADALRLRDRILVTATELFLSEGYGSTSIEAIARRAGVSKRTLYDRFDDKSVLFTAVVHRIIEHIRPAPDVPLVEGDTLAAILRRLALLILNAALSPQAIALHRLVNAEAARFPELVRAVGSDGSTREATDLIGDLLDQKLTDVRLSAATREFAASQFVYMVVTLPQRRAMGFGTPMRRDELQAWAADVVALFLEGCRGLGR